VDFAVWRVWKTGFEFFDLARAYGLSLFLYAGTDYLSDVLVREHPAYFLVTISPPIQKWQKTTPWSVEWEGKGWNYVFKTFRGINARLIAGNKKDARQVLEIEAPTIINTFDLRAKLLRQDDPEADNNTMKTIWGPLDPSAIKGTRGGSWTGAEPPILSDPVNWALSLLGAKELFFPFNVKKSSGGWTTYVLAPFPFCVSMKTSKEIVHLFREKRKLGKCYSVRHAGAWFAVRLYQWLLEGIVNHDIQETSFSRIGCFELSGGKILSGSFLDLSVLNEFLGRVTEDPKNNEQIVTLSTLLDLWDSIFLYAAVKKGGENIALTLADLIFNPNLDNYERHILTVFKERLHLESLSQLTRRGKRSIRLYNRKLLEEVMSHVEVV